jgi:hypothetical protein
MLKSPRFSLAKILQLHPSIASRVLFPINLPHQPHIILGFPLSLGNNLFLKEIIFILKKKKAFQPILDKVYQK